MSDNSYRVITRLVKKPECIGIKRVHTSFKNDCGICCTGSLWPKPCKDENYINCDECVCNHCKDCRCEIVGEPNADRCTEKSGGSYERM